jgi:dUTP pyrophosphatase
MNDTDPPVLRVRRVRPDAVLPRFAHPDDSGMDVCACEDRVLQPGERAKIPLGIAFAPPPGTEIQLRPRSGLAIRDGISMVNTPATIDEGYRGEVCAILINHGSEPFHVEKGMRIAQAVLCPILRPRVVEADELPETARGAGGFGSTGT